MDEAERETQAAGEPSHARRAMCDESRPTPPHHRRCIALGWLRRLSAAPTAVPYAGMCVRSALCRLETAPVERSVAGGGAEREETINRTNCF